MGKCDQLAVELLRVSTTLLDRISGLEAQKEPYNALLRFGLGHEPNFVISDDNLEMSHRRFLGKIEKNKGFSWCKRQKDIVKAFDVLEGFQDKMDLPVRSKMIHDLQFYAAVAFWLGFAFKDAFWKPETISLEEKRTALKTANDLVEFLARRGWRKRPRKSEELVSTLNKLVSDLSRPAPRDYSGPSARQKLILTNLATNLRRLGLKYDCQIGELIEHIGKPMGFEPHLRTIARYVHESKS